MENTKLKDITFQVVCMDKSDFIIEYKDFNWDSHECMLEYISEMTTQENVNKICVDRWNMEKGQRI
jgi:hypothetical protein